MYKNMYTTRNEYRNNIVNMLDAKHRTGMDTTFRAKQKQAECAVKKDLYM